MGKKSGAGAAWGKNQELEPLEKKSGAGAGAAKKVAGSPALVVNCRLKSDFRARSLFDPIKIQN